MVFKFQYYIIVSDIWVWINFVFNYNINAVCVVAPYGPSDENVEESETFWDNDVLNAVNKDLKLIVFISLDGWIDDRKEKKV